MLKKKDCDFFSDKKESLKILFFELRTIVERRQKIMSQKLVKVCVNQIRCNHINMACWQKMNFEQRIDLALTESDPDSADIAFYKGLGLRKLGQNFSSEAIFAFRRAMKLDPTYKTPCENHIKIIFKALR